MRVHWKWMLLVYLLSLLPGGMTALAIGDRTPALLYSDIFLLGLVYLFLLNVLIKDNRIIGDKPVLILAFFFFAAQILSLMINESDVYKGILSIKIFAHGVLTYVIVLSFCRTERDIDWVTYSLVILTTVMSIILIFKFTTDLQPYDDLDKEMISLGMGKSNYLASLLVLFVPVTFGLVMSERRLMIRAVFAVAVLLMFLALIVTMSRGAALSLALVLGIMLPLMLKIKTKITYGIVSAAAFICLYHLVPAVVPESFLQKNAQLLIHRLQNLDYSRLSLISLAWEDFLKNPLFGIGPFQTQSRFSQYEMMPHNFIFQTLAELGLLGGIPFLSIIMIFLIRSFKNCSYPGIHLKWKNENLFFLAGIIGTLIHGLIELTFQGVQYMSVFWTFMAVVTLKYRSFPPRAGVRVPWNRGIGGIA